MTVENDMWRITLAALKIGNEVRAFSPEDF
jgi:hypothetical protein